MSVISGDSCGTSAESNQKITAVAITQPPTLSGTGNEYWSK